MMEFSKKHLATLLLWLKRLGLVAFIAFLGWEIYDRLIRSVIDGNFRFSAFIALWLLTAYIVLPRIHRFLTRLYVPDYFIGRVRTQDGLLADPVNLAVNGSKRQLQQMFTEAGWVEADPITLGSAWRMVVSSLLRKSYPSAPVSPLFLFGVQQSVAFQQEVNGNPHARHHVRFWKTPHSWWLPGGTKVDWLGAATYDHSVGFSLFTGQITHKIAEDTDQERNYVWRSLNSKKVSLQRLPHFMTAYRTRAGGGDAIMTDGTLFIISTRH
jgi:hypothetical protein